MKSLSLLILLFLADVKPVKNEVVHSVDLKRYAGTWYSLYSIPTMFDNGSRQTSGKYTWNSKGYFDVVTSYKNAGDDEVKTVRSKVFQVPGTNNAQMKAQFLWPYKVDYWVIELADDYSYVVVGHPDHKFLFIMSRKPKISNDLYQGIISRCKARGYDTGKLTSQQHG